MVRNILNGYMTALQVAERSGHTDRNIRTLAEKKIIRGVQITGSKVWIFPVENAREFIRVHKKKKK